MNFKVITIPPFDRQLKGLAKKYPSILNELRVLGKELAEQPFSGVELGKYCYKIRLAIESKGKGKSGGARIITNIHISNEIVYLLSICDKSEKENLTDKELIALLSEIPD
jgi:mRNA-degrading endonuclease RelE of RelBE toxin-antitoxin system